MTALTKDELLAPVRKWTRKMKERLCRGIHAEVITANEAMAAHGISAEELNTWYAAFRHGRGIPNPNQREARP